MTTSAATPILQPSLPDLGLEAAPAHNPWLIAIVVTMATFMEVLDTTIANVALPHIAGNLAAGQDESTWVLTSYLVSNAIILPISGWLSTVIGRKRFYMSCVALFTLSSFLCGIAPTLPWLIFFRILQGIGGGGLQPSEQAILVDTFPREKRGMAFAVAGIAMVTAPIIGPTLGGWITDNYSWRWCFYINVPVGIVSLLLSYHLVQDPPHARARRRDPASSGPGRRIDFIGLGLIALGLGSLQVVLDKGERDDWFSSGFIVGFAFISALALILAVVWEWRSKDPVVDLHLLKERNFATANITMFLVGFSMFGATVLIPQLLQTQMGYTATQAGLVLSPGGIVVMVMMPMVGMLVSRIQPRWLIGFGMLVTGLSLFYMTRFDLQMDYRMAVVTRCFQAAGIAFVFIPTNTLAYSNLPPGKNNNASALINLSRNMGASVGIAACATLLARRQQAHQTHLIANISPFNHAYTTLLQNITAVMMRAGGGADPARAQQMANAMIYRVVGGQAAMLAYIDCFWVLGFACLATLPLLFFMKKVKGGKGGGGH